MKIVKSVKSNMETVWIILSGILHRITNPAQILVLLKQNVGMDVVILLMGQKFVVIINVYYQINAVEIKF